MYVFRLFVKKMNRSGNYLIGVCVASVLAEETDTATFKHSGSKIYNYG